MAPYTALLLPTSMSESSSFVLPDHPILLMLYEVTLCGTHKTNVHDLSDGSRLQQNIDAEKNWVLCREFFKLERLLFDEFMIF